MRDIWIASLSEKVEDPWGTQYSPILFSTDGTESEHLALLWISAYDFGILLWLNVEYIKWRMNEEYFKFWLSHQIW